MNKIKDKETFVNVMKTFTKTWSSQIDLSLESNLDLFIGDSGNMGELLGYFITGKKGKASAGSGFDLYDPETNKADESKLAVNVRGSYCNPKQNGCGKRYLFWNKPEICTCGNKLTRDGGSRFGIDAAAAVEYHSQLENYILQIIDPVEYTKDNRKFIYRAFLIKSDNKSFMEYTENQYYNATSNNCNLLPDSYDFYRAQPIKVVELLIDLDADTIEVIKFDVDNTIPEEMDLKVLRSKELIKYNQLIQKGITDLNILFPLRNKALNKNRGETSRN